jgi:hypothetical protein
MYSLGTLFVSGIYIQIPCIKEMMMMMMIIIIIIVVIIQANTRVWKCRFRVVRMDKDMQVMIITIIIIIIGEMRRQYK